MGGAGSEQPPRISRHLARFLFLRPETVPGFGTIVLGFGAIVQVFGAFAEREHVQKMNGFKLNQSFQVIRLFLPPAHAWSGR